MNNYKLIFSDLESSQTPELGFQPLFPLLPVFSSQFLTSPGISGLLAKQTSPQRWNHCRVCRETLICSVHIQVWNCSPQCSLQPILPQKQGAGCSSLWCQALLSRDNEKAGTPFPAMKSTARTSKRQPQIQPFEDGEASTASGYQSHKIFITEKKNPSYDNLSTEPPSPDPSEKLPSWSYFGMR